MRISKVKVQDNNRKVMVLMHRTTVNGALVYEGETNVRTSEILPKKKSDSFALSIDNKTLIKRDSLKDKKQKDNYDIVKKIITKRVLPIQISDEDVLPVLNHKFQNEIIYYKNNEPYSFRLASLIVEAVKERNPEKLQPYDDWKNWYISTKSSHLIQSIEQNKIDLTGTDSKRKSALQAWATKYTTSGSIDLSFYHKLYAIDTLAGALHNTEKGELDQEKNTPKNINLFHRNLKKTLQTHQKTVFGTREAPNVKNRKDEQLAIYHLEVVKYLEHYFSVKSTQRKNTQADIDYYLKAETIKSTITNQLSNAVRNYLLQKGKAEHHKFDNTTDSSRLTEIKRNEAFVLNMIDACAFAANNIRNIVDTEQTNDILGKTEYVQSLKKTNRVNKQLFKFFFGTDLPATDSHKAKTLWAMRGAVQQIRNAVIHYKQGALDTIFKIEKFEYPDFEDQSYTDTIYKTCLETELQQVPEAFAQQLKTGGVLAYYPYDDLKALLNTVSFSLCRTVVPFAPSFKKVQKQGQNYQNAQNENFYDLVLKSYLPKEKDASKEEAYNARYFLLKLIYNNLFLRNFTENRTQFSKTVNYILSQNKKQAEASKNSKAYAFEAVRQMKEEESISDYMAYIQSQLMLEKNKKEDDKSEDTHINFEKFVLQVFIKGFDDFLQDEKFKFIAKPYFQLSKDETKQTEQLNQFEQGIINECRVQSHSINTEEATHVAFFTFCKLLDATHLSNLRNELIKFKQSAKQFELSHMLEIIELTLLNADRVPADYRKLYENKTDCLNRILFFIADGIDFTKWSDLFVQTDNETPVVHANVELTVKYGTAKLLEQLIAKDVSFKLSKSNFTLWNKAKDTIEVLINKRLDLHKQWEEAVRKDKEEKNKKIKPRSNFAQKFINKEGNDYSELCEYIDDYNWQVNKLHFVHLSRLHHLTIDILGRMAGFIALFDRDFQLFDASRTQDPYQLKAFVSLSNMAKDLNKQNDIAGIKGMEYVVKRDGSPITEADRNSLKDCIQNKREYFSKVFFLKGSKQFEVRNYIAHFNYLSTTAENYSLIDLLNEIRDLLSYDRKLKNAVNKAFIDLFDKQGMELKLKLNANHRFEIESVNPKLIYHLGTTLKSEDPISFYQVKLEYCNMCRALLEMKKQPAD